MDKSGVQTRLTAIFEILDKFNWLTDAYMIEFFTNNSWQKLPVSWRLFFESCLREDTGANVNEITQWILDECNSRSSQTLVPPLSLLALRKCSKCYSVSRTQLDEQSFEEILFSDVDSQNPLGGIGCRLLRREPFSVPSLTFDKADRRKLKAKKEHEIQKVAKLISVLRSGVQIDRIIDVGAGLGHLSRLLSLLHNPPKISTIEANTAFVDEARRLDGLLQRSKLTSELPQHVNMMVALGAGERVTGHQTLKTLVGNTAENIALVGLHTCGDLAPAMIKEYIANKNISVLVSFGCCYMKLNGGQDREDIQHYPAASDVAINSTATQNGDGCPRDKRFGFPLSQFCRVHGHILGYAARELSCHALDEFVKGLGIASLPTENRLNVHCYRAVLEYLIQSCYPDCRKLGLAEVKKAYSLDFYTYANLALRKRNDMDMVMKILDNPNQMSEVIASQLSLWGRVVVFYSLRLLIAPLIESAILLDRILRLREHGHYALLLPVFDVFVSPRNIAVVSIRSASTEQLQSIQKCAKQL